MLGMYTMSMTCTPCRACTPRQLRLAIARGHWGKRQVTCSGFSYTRLGSLPPLAPSLFPLSALAALHIGIYSAGPGSTLASASIRPSELQHTRGLNTRDIT